MKKVALPDRVSVFSTNRREQINDNKKNSCEISPDVHASFERAIKDEQAERSKRAFKSTLESLDQSAKLHNLLCPDTGWPLFFCKTGNDAKIEGGILGLEEIAKEMVARATKEDLIPLLFDAYI